ncbi:MAG: glycosyltransferase [Rickettsiales bacterium]
MPAKTRAALRDLCFLSIETFILNTEIYRQWKRGRNGTERLRSFFGGERTFIPMRPQSAPRAPALTDWQALGPERKRSEVYVSNARIDVVMPVYLGYAETLSAIYTVLASSCVTPYEFIVINDASPEQPLASMLKNLAQEGWFTLIEHPQNQGFPASANEGFNLHPDRDIVLLNSDTEVYGNWLDRLVAAAESDSEAGTVTPLSNNGSICSYPRFAKPTIERLEADGQVFDALTAEVNRQVAIRIPTAVGFCMYIKRSCLKQIGDFDDRTFKRGYGEENDFCLRATQWGWKHLLAADVYVTHHGGVSFGKDKERGERRAWRILTRRYPQYRLEVRDFLAQDPLFAVRQRLDIARLQRYSSTNNILMIHHTAGGGVLQHVRGMVHMLREESVGTFQLTPEPDGSLRLSHPAIPLTPSARFSMEFDRSAFYEAVLNLGINHIHIHHTLGFPNRFLDFVQVLSQEMNVRYDITIHDYYWLCSCVNLLCGKHIYQGDPDVITSERCITQNGAHADGLTAWEWRLRHATLLRGARSVYVPDQDVLARMKRHIPDATYVLRPHPEYFDNGSNLSSIPPKPGEIMRVGLMGILSNAKGANIVAALVKDAKARNLPIHYTLIGKTEHPDLVKETEHFTMTGHYRETDLEDLLKTHQPHQLFFPSVWPETYSYALSIAWRYGIHPVVFDLGAPAMRIRNAGVNAGTVIPLDFTNRIEELSERLLNIRLPKETLKPRNHDYFTLMDYYYGFSKLEQARMENQS